MQCIVMFAACMYS